MRLKQISCSYCLECYDCRSVDRGPQQTSRVLEFESGVPLVAGPRSDPTEGFHGGSEECVKPVCRFHLKNRLSAGEREIRFCRLAIHLAMLPRVQPARKRRQPIS